MVEINNLTKYLLEGLIVALAAFYIPHKIIKLNEILIIASIAASVFAVLDSFIHVISNNALNSASFDIDEGFDDSTMTPKNLEAVTGIKSSDQILNMKMSDYNKYDKNGKALIKWFTKQANKPNGRFWDDGDINIQDYLARSETDYFVVDFVEGRIT